MFRKPFKSLFWSQRFFYNLFLKQNRSSGIASIAFSCAVKSTKISYPFILQASHPNLPPIVTLIQLIFSETIGFPFINY